MKKVAIAGLGVVAPSGIDQRVFWANLKAGHSFVKEITRFDASLYPSHIAGQIHELDAYTHVSSRLLKKMDVFEYLLLQSSFLWNNCRYCLCQNRVFPPIPSLKILTLPEFKQISPVGFIPSLKMVSPFLYSQ